MSWFTVLYVWSMIFWAGYVAGSWREQIAPWWALLGCLVWPVVFVVLYVTAWRSRRRIRQWNSWTVPQRQAWAAKHPGKFPGPPS